MDKFTTYLAAVDGSNDWSTIGPLFMDAFDPDCVVVTAAGEVDRDGWASMAQGLVASGASISDFEASAPTGDSFVYKMTLNVPGEQPLSLAARGTLKDGRLFRVEPVDPAQYSALVDRSR